MGCHLWGRTESDTAEVTAAAAAVTWVWVNSRSWWWTGRPGVLRFMGSQRVGHDRATELNWTECIYVNPNLPIHPPIPTLPYKKRIASPGSMQDTGCLGLVHWDVPSVTAIQQVINLKKKLWEEGLGEDGYMCMYGWVPSLFTGNYHNIVNRLYPNTK